MSDIKQINGIKYDRSMLEKAAELVVGQGDGRISRDDAAQLFIKAMDAGKLTQIELDTFNKIKKEFNFTGSARMLLNFLIGQALGIKNDRSKVIDVELPQPKIKQ